MQKIIRQAFGKPVTIGLVGGHNLSICVSYLNMVTLSNNDCSNVGMLASCCSEMNEMRVLVQQQEPLSLIKANKTRQKKRSRHSDVDQDGPPDKKINFKPGILQTVHQHILHIIMHTYRVILRFPYHQS